MSQVRAKRRSGDERKRSMERSCHIARLAEMAQVKVVLAELAESPVRMNAMLKQRQ